MPNLNVKVNQSAIALIVLDNSTKHGEVLLDCFVRFRQDQIDCVSANLKAACQQHRYSSDGKPIYGALKPCLRKPQWLLHSHNIYCFEEHWSKYANKVKTNPSTTKGLRFASIFSTPDVALSALFSAFPIAYVLQNLKGNISRDYVDFLQEGMNSLMDLYLTLPTVTYEVEE